MNIGKELAITFFFGEISNKYPKSKKFQFIKTTNWSFPHTVQRTKISGAPKFYTNANKLYVRINKRSGSKHL